MYDLDDVDFDLSNYMYMYSKRNGLNKGFSLQPASIASEISLCGNFANANFRPVKISRVRIFAMAKLISQVRIFAPTKFRQTKFRFKGYEISFDTTKIRVRFD